MRKRIILTLLALCLMLTLLPGLVLAADSSGRCGANVTWELDSSGLLTISGTGPMTNYNVISNFSPFHMGSAKSVEINEGVTTIGSCAFGWMFSLKTVEIPRSVVSIGSEAFINSNMITDVYYAGTEDEWNNITIASGNYMLDRATIHFEDTEPDEGDKTPTSQLTWVLSGDGTLTISGTGKMKDYTGGGAGAAPWYADRKKIKTVIIEEGVTSIGYCAFWDCTNITTMRLPNTLTTIGGFSLALCTSLEAITIPLSVTQIDFSAFGACHALTGITIPDGITKIEGQTFAECTGLKGITIPSGVTSIGEIAFQTCTSLASVAIPNSVTFIGDNAFYECDSLTDVYYDGSESQWNQIEFGKDNDPLLNAAIHFSDTEPEHIYGTNDPGGDTKLDTERLNKVTDTASAASAVQAQAQSMTREQRESATGTDLATLYAETAIAKAASKTVTGREIIINKAAVADLEAVAAQTNSAVDTALVNGGIATARYLSNTVTLTTDETGEITIRIDPDILTTSVDKIRVETPTYALTLKVPELEPDLIEIITISAQDVGSGYAPGNQDKKTTVQVNLPRGKTTNPVTVSLPKDSGDANYQAVVKTDGSLTPSKYNPATTTMDGKITTSGTYTVQNNKKDFTDIANKSAEMQAAIRYLASKGIINGITDTSYAPDASISRAEIAALIVRALGKLDNSATNSFTDVTSGDWYYSAAGSSQRMGIITGYEDKTFRGTTVINKEQIVVVAARVLTSEMNYKTPGNPAQYLSKYSDSVSSWAQPQVALATRENLLIYREDGTFYGAKNMTRGDAAIIINRLFQKIW